MGDVYAIRGDALGNRLALKLLQKELLGYPKLVKRFRREGRLQAGLEHRAIVRVFDLVQVDGRPGLVMEFIDAPTMRSWLDTASPTAAEVRRVAGELLDGLAVAHAAGVVHRDIKPENVFILGEGAGISAKLIDFGIAKSMDAGEDAHLTTVTVFDEYIGTYAYSSPEQLMQSSSVDPRSDLFSLGVVLWEAVSGVSPWPGARAPAAVMMAVLNDPLPRLPSDVPDDLQRLIVELTRKDRQERVQTAAEALAMLGDSAVGLRSVTTFDPGPADLSGPTHPLIPAFRPTDAKVTPVAKAAEPTEVEHPTIPANPPPGPQTALAVIDSAPAALGDSAKLKSRIKGHLLDQRLPLLTLLTCVGGPFYPVLVVLRGVRGRTPGQLRAGVQLVNAATGRPAGRGRVVGRNVLELLLFHGPFALAVWPPYLAGTGGASLLLLLWVGAVGLAEWFAATRDPLGRRLLDRLVATRVVTAPVRTPPRDFLGLLGLGTGGTTP